MTNGEGVKVRGGGKKIGRKGGPLADVNSN